MRRTMNDIKWLKMPAVNTFQAKWMFIIESKIIADYISLPRNKSIVKGKAVYVTL